MRTTRQMSVTLPHEMADLVGSKVASGEYASESEVIRDGLRALAARDRAVETFLLERVAPPRTTAFRPTRTARPHLPTVACSARLTAQPVKLLGALRP